MGGIVAEGSVCRQPARPEYKFSRLPRLIVPIVFAVSLSPSCGPETRHFTRSGPDIAGLGGRAGDETQKANNAGEIIAVAIAGSHGGKEVMYRLSGRRQITEPSASAIRAYDLQPPAMQIQSGDRAVELSQHVECACMRFGRARWNRSGLRCHDAVEADVELGMGSFLLTLALSPADGRRVCPLLSRRSTQVESLS